MVHLWLVRELDSKLIVLNYLLTGLCMMYSCEPIEALASCKILRNSKGTECAA